MSMTDQKPRIATEEDIKAPWSGVKGGRHFRCKLCGHKFQVGDYWRFVFCTHGNILVCEKCDNNPGAKWTQIHEEWEKLKQGKFWWFISQLEDSVICLESEASQAARECRYNTEYWKDKALCAERDR